MKTRFAVLLLFAMCVISGCSIFGLSGGKVSHSVVPEGFKVDVFIKSTMQSGTVAVQSVVSSDQSFDVSKLSKLLEYFHKQKADVYRVVVNFSNKSVVCVGLRVTFWRTHDPESKTVPEQKNQNKKLEFNSSDRMVMGSNLIKWAVLEEDRQFVIEFGGR